MDDVIIIGGSFAGHSHGLLGHDHKPPLEILAEARQQLARYPTIRLVNARADCVSGAIDDFSVLTGDGESLGARRLILSYGVADQMPDVPGLAESWATSIVPCPYCDGFEVAGQHWGLVWSGPQSHNSVRLFHDWTDTLTLFADGHDIPPDIRADLARRNIAVVEGRIIEIAHHGGHIATVNLDTRRNVAVDVLFAHPRNKPSASLHESPGPRHGGYARHRPQGRRAPPNQHARHLRRRRPCHAPLALGHPGVIAGRDGGYLRPAVDAGLRAQIGRESSQWANTSTRST
jgi:thioredoxin reductase